MRARLAAGVAAIALLAGACDAGAAGSEDLASVEGRAAEADVGEPDEGPTPDDGPPMPPLARIETGFEGALVTTPGGPYEAAVTVVEENGRTTTRRFRYHVPPGDGPFPLVIAIHGLGSSAERFDELTRLGLEGSLRGAVVVLPDALDRSWNASLTCCQPAIEQDLPDAAFVLELPDVVEPFLPIDRDRIGVTGFSNGGYLSYRIACAAGGRVARIAPVAGTMDLPCEPSAPVGVLHLHGDADRIVPLVDDRAPFTPGAAGRSARHVTDFWARVAGCDVDPATEEQLASSVAYADCEVPVSLEVFEGVEHTWTERTTQAVLEFLIGDGR